MDHISIETLGKLRAVGFTYPEYEHFINYGMVYYYNGDEYFIGGYSTGDFSERDKEVAKYGEWLPDSSQLLSWLTDTAFSVTISVEDLFFSVQAIDTVDGTQYIGRDVTPANALAKTIIKICKANRRPYVPPIKPRLEIIP